MYNYKKSVLSPHDLTKLAIHCSLRPEEDFISNCGPKVKKSVSFDDIVHFIDKEDMVTYVDFDCGFAFFPETPTKIRQINRERNYISGSCDKPQCIPSNNQHTCSVDEQHISHTLLNRTNYGTWFQQVLCHSSTLMIHTLCSISNLNQQLNNLEQTHIRCSLHCERWTVKERDYASALHSFKEIIYRTDE